jgi:oligopeptide transport system substrate-binding protein
MVYQLPPGTYEKYKAQYPKEIRNSPMLGLRYYSYLNTDPLLKDMQGAQGPVDGDRPRHPGAARDRGRAKARLQVFVEGMEGGETTTYDWATGRWTSVWPKPRSC